MREIKIIVLLILSIPRMWGQNEDIEKLSKNQLKRFAQHAELNQDAYTAITYYEKYCELESTDIKSLHHLADNYRISKNYEKAASAYQKCYELSHENDKEALFYYAQMLKINGNTKEAVKRFKEFLASGITFKNVDILRRLASSEIQGCEDLGMHVFNDSLRVLHLDSSINRSYSEGAPFMADDSTLLFSTIRSDEVVYIQNDDEEITSQPVKTRKIYKAVRKDSSWIADDNFSSPANEEGENSSNLCISADGKRMYFTRTTRNWKNQQLSAIYVSTKKGNDWSEPVYLTELNEGKSTNTQPTLGRSSKPGYEVVYFISDRPGTLGGKDIWYSLYNIKKDTYTTPRNAGGVINTAGDEITPFFDSTSNVLYYSSNGKAGFGGFDVFKTAGENSHWAIPDHLEAPINSSYDDVYFIVNNKTGMGFFASNRPGNYKGKHTGCCDDLYTFDHKSDRINIKGTIVENKDTNAFEYLSSTLTDSVMQPLSGAVVNLYALQGKNKDPYLVMKDTTDEQGHYELKIRKEGEYKIVISKEGFLSFSKEFQAPELQADPMLAGMELKRITSAPLVIRNLNYEFGKYELTENMRHILDITLYKVLLDNPSLKIEIASHTDSVGGDVFNLTLSEKRAAKVSEYLISKGIEPERLLTQGYGETHPLVSNTKPDGTDNPSGRELNRRTEFRILELVRR